VKPLDSFMAAFQTRLWRELAVATVPLGMRNAERSVRENARSLDWRSHVRVRAEEGSNLVKDALERIVRSGAVLCAR